MHLFLQLEQKGHEIDSFFSSTNKKQTDTSKGNSTLKDKDKEKHVPSIKKLQQDASRREAAAQKRMQDLIRQFGPILRQVAIFHLLFLFVGVCCGRGKYDICVHHYQSVNCLFVWICFFAYFESYITMFFYTWSCKPSVSVHDNKSFNDQSMVINCFFFLHVLAFNLFLLKNICLAFSFFLCFYFLFCSL